LLHSQNGGLAVYQFANLTEQGLVHAIFTRLGGVSPAPFDTLNVGSSVGDDQAKVTENHARILSFLSLSGDAVATAQQVHGNRVVTVMASDGGQVQPGTDGLITNRPGLALLLRFADCQPILLYDSAQHCLGLVHAGWRGVALGIASRAVEAMQAAFGTRPEDLLAGLGPAIGPCCYMVGDEVAAAMGYVLPDWSAAMDREGDGWRLNLTAANAQQLAAKGVRSIEEAGLCTACHTDLFYSHRAEGGRTGRFAVMAHLRPREAIDDESLSSVERPGDVQATGKPMASQTLSPPGFPGFAEMTDTEL
jgi:YfiH family protein